MYLNSKALLDNALDRILISIGGEFDWTNLN
jgi:hypothetical protein